MYAPAPTAEVRFESQPGLSSAVCRTLDDLAGRALLTSSVQRTPAGTVSRREAILQYVKRYWPQPAQADKVSRWFNTWVTNLRRDSLQPQLNCKIL
jgi:hypothetical protein